MNDNAHIFILLYTVVWAAVGFLEGLIVSKLIELCRRVKKAESGTERTTWSL